MIMFREFLIRIAAIALVYVAQTCFKVKQTRKNNSFDWKELWQGLIDNLIYFAGALALFSSGLLLPDIKVAMITNPETGSIIQLGTIDMMMLLAMALYIKQSTKAFNNIQSTFELTSIGKIEEAPYNNGNGVSK